jgi:ribosome-associated translation inhibitor RaiA
MTEEKFNFEFEFQSKLGDIGELEDKLYNEADSRLRKLTKGHTDITGASIILEPVVQGTQTSYLIRARVIAYTRPDYINGEEEADTALAALKGALSAVERQVRDKRDKLRETWKQPGGMTQDPEPSPDDLP